MDARQLTVTKKNKNQGKLFWSCGKYGASRCNFFRWVEEFSAADAKFVVPDDYEEEEEEEEEDEDEAYVPASPPPSPPRKRRRRRQQIRATSPRRIPEYTKIPMPILRYMTVDVDRIPLLMCHVCGEQRYHEDVDEIWRAAGRLVDEMNAPIPMFTACEECARTISEAILDEEVIKVYGKVVKVTSLNREAMDNL